ncbi:hypothetical protein JD969_15470 [Planctomycetota bacterium]|nr:hypothetical protein JD969_15470 [Planctomycetota bacterium]
MPTPSPIKKLPPIPKSAPVKDGHVSKDFACHQCEYNLRTQSIHNNCPECGHSVYKSLIYRSTDITNDNWYINLKSSQTFIINLSVIAALLSTFAILLLNPINILPIGINVSPCILIVFFGITSVILLTCSCVCIGDYTDTPKYTPPKFIYLKSRIRLARTNAPLVISCLLFPIFILASLAIPFILTNHIRGQSSADQMTLYSDIITPALFIPLTYLFVFTLASRFTNFFTYTSYITTHFSLNKISNSCKTLAKVNKIIFRTIIYLASLLYIINGIELSLSYQDYLNSFHQSSSKSYHYPSHLTFLNHSFTYLCIIIFFLMIFNYSFTALTARKIRSCALAHIRNPKLII